MGLRVAVIGCGYWGSKHVRVLHSIDGVDEVVPSTGAERLAALGRAVSRTRRGSRRCTLRCRTSTPSSWPRRRPSHVPLALEPLPRASMYLSRSRSPRAARRPAADHRRRPTPAVVLMVGPHVRVQRRRVEAARTRPAQRARRRLLHRLGAAEPRAVPERRQRHLRPRPARHVDHQSRARPSTRSPSRPGDRGTRTARFEDVAYLRLYYEDERLSANIHVSWLDPCKVRRVTAVGSREDGRLRRPRAEDRIRILDKGVGPGIGLRRPHASRRCPTAMATSPRPSSQRTSRSACRTATSSGVSPNRQLPATPTGATVWRSSRCSRRSTVAVWRGGGSNSPRCAGAAGHWSADCARPLRRTPTAASGAPLTQERSYDPGRDRCPSPTSAR